MAIKEPRIVNLENYFDSSRVLVVPDYQRDYTWGVGDSENENQVVQLLSDLSQFVNSDATEYLLGLIILADTDESISGRKVKKIVDGQQRTVTLSIFLMCSYEYLHNMHGGMAPINQALFFSRLQKLFAIRDHDVIVGERIRFSQDDSNKVLQKIHTWSTSTIKEAEEKLQILSLKASDATEVVLDSTMENLLNAREYLSTELYEGNWFEGDFKHAIEKILSGIKFLELEISDGNQAFEIYDRMNNRGLALSSADLIKNQLFINVPSGPDYQLISSTWNQMTKNLLGHGPKRFQDPEFLVRAHAAMTWGMTVRESELAKKYQGYFSGSDKLPTGVEKLEPVAFVERLSEYSLSTVDMCAEKGGEPLIYAARFLGAVQHFPLLLAAQHIVDPLVQQYFLKQVGARTLLQIFSKEHPPHVESIYPAWAHEVYIHRINLTTEKLDDIYNNFAFTRGESDKVSLEEIKKYKKERFESLMLQVDSWQYHSSSKRKIKATLALVSWWMDGRLKAEHGFTIVDYLKLKTETTNKRWELDHILASEYKLIAMSEEKRNNIGNLVLLEDKKNKAASNKAPSDKSEIYSTKSSLTFTKITENKSADTYEKDLAPILKSMKWTELKWDLSNWNSQGVDDRREFIKSVLTLILDAKR